MKAFFDAKKFELLLAAVTPFVLVLGDAWESGAFHGKDVTTGILIAVLILARAAASHRQSPPPTLPTVNVPSVWLPGATSNLTSTTTTNAGAGDIPGPNPGA